MEKKLRDDAKRMAKEMGIPLTTAVNAMVKQFVRDGVIVLATECPYPSHTPNAETRKAIREVQEYKAGKRGKVKSYATANEMFADILGKS
jgi:antitoxin component of RelBE/YafQ-DinJ toxin-antitoxin module